jgi:hypothetical protein
MTPLLGVGKGGISGVSIITSGLVGYWKLDEPSGTTVIDSSGNGYNGTYTGTTTSGSVPSGIHFSDPACRVFSPSGYATIPNPGGLSISTAPFSLSLWLKITTTSGYQVLVEEQSGSVFSLQDWNGVTDSITLAVGGGGGANVTSSAPNVADGNWHNVIAVINFFGAGGAAIYVGGSPATLTGNTPQTPAPTGQPVLIGGRSGSFTANGSLDDVRIYNRALTAGEIAQIAAGNG